MPPLLTNLPSLFKLMARDYRGWGYQLAGREAFGVNIGKVPFRKRWALYADTGNNSLVLAYFRSPEHAQLAMTLIETLLSGSPPHPSLYEPVPDQEGCRT